MKENMKSEIMELFRQAEGAELNIRLGYQQRVALASVAAQYNRAMKIKVLLYRFTGDQGDHEDITLYASPHEWNEKAVFRICELPVIAFKLGQLPLAQVAFIKQPWALKCVRSFLSNHYQGKFSIVELHDSYEIILREKSFKNNREMAARLSEYATKMQADPELPCLEIAQDEITDTYLRTMVSRHNVLLSSRLSVHFNKSKKVFKVEKLSAKADLTHTSKVLKKNMDADPWLIAQAITELQTLKDAVEKRSQ